MVKKVNFMLCASRPYILTIGNGCKGKRESQKIILIQATGRTKGTNKKEKEKKQKNKTSKVTKKGLHLGKGLYILVRFESSLTDLIITIRGKEKFQDI